MRKKQQPWIVQIMSKSSFYDHPAKNVELIETHISWLFLAGDFAYKVKKPINLGFLDFSTLAKRHHFCHEELRLNRRFAPQLYLKVMTIGGETEAAAPGKTPALEYAVKMRRFPRKCQLDRMLEAGQLRAHHLTDFARSIAEQHRSATSLEPAQPYGSARSVIEPMLENFKQIEPPQKKTRTAQQLKRLMQWTGTVFAKLESALTQRREEGFIRECHGDTHLGNMAWLNGQPLLFDCIEFNENLRWIDVISDISFLVMDLDDRGQPALGWHFLNHYLQETGDYQGVALLNFYKVYRAMVRAKVLGLRLSQGDLNEQERSETESLFQSYLDLAERYTLQLPPPLIMTHGFSGSGKSTFTAKLAESYGGIHIRSDVERKRLHGLTASAQSGSPLNSGIYSKKASVDTYLRLRDIASTTLCCGLPVCVDATFLMRKQRELFLQLADDLKVPLIIVDFPLPEEVLRKRIEQRSRNEEVDASEATLKVLYAQLDKEEPLTSNERQKTIRVDPDIPAEATVRAIREILDCGQTS